MTPERLLAAESLFLQALERPLPEREEWLARACGGDEELRADVERLLKEDQGGETWVRRAVGEAAAAAGEGSSMQPGAWVGPYRIDRLIGKGGGGSVYLATRADQQYHKQVAVKVLRGGLADVAHRDLFVRERQILAQLDHPYIARLLDGGTLPDGQPYLVLDYVEGLPVPEFCESNHSSLRQKLALFIRVCEGVSYAHQNLIVHRDLKPGNILITADGTPKLLDFGIAKLLGGEFAPATDVTQVPAGLMTPQYASPEQLSGAPITTATDVYSLGVILYELLAGVWPYEVHGLPVTEITRKIVVEPVERPSRRCRPGRERIPADLDNVVLKALEKDPARRYRSADLFAEDLRRYLRGLPVVARGDSVAYRARKFVRRRWAPLAAAAAIVVSLGALALESQKNAFEQGRLRAAAESERSSALAARDEAQRARMVAEDAALEAGRQRSEAQRQQREAERQRAAADLRFQQVRQLANRFLFEFHDAIAMLPGSTPARQLVVKTALEYLDGLTKDKADPQLLAEVATAYERVGDVQGNAYFANLGDTAGAWASYQKALALRSKLPVKTSAGERDLVMSHVKLGDSEEQRGRAAEARKQYDRAVELYERSVYEDRFRWDGGWKAYLRRADLNEKTNRSKEALEDAEKALQLGQKLRVFHPGDARYSRDISATWEKAGRMRIATGDVAGGIAANRRALEEANLAVTADSANQMFLRQKFIALIRLGYPLMSTSSEALRNPEEAFLLLSEARQVAETLHRMDPQNTQSATDLAIAWEYVGLWHEYKDQWREAVEAHRNALAAAEQLEKRNPGNPLFREATALRRVRFGATLAELPDYEGSLREMRAALAVLEDRLAGNPGNKSLAVKLVQIWRDIGEVLRLSGRPSEGIEPNLRAAKDLEAMISADPANKTLPPHLSPIYQQIAKCHQDLARKAGTEEERRRHWRETLEWFVKAQQVGGPFSRRPFIAAGIKEAEAALASMGR